MHIVITWIEGGKPLRRRDGTVATFCDRYAANDWARANLNALSTEFLRIQTMDTATLAFYNANTGHAPAARCQN